MEGSQTSGTLRSVQVLRGASAMAVALYHALQWRDGGFDVGRAGVDVFFVISGLIMWRVTAGRDVSPRAFLWRRVTRVAPLYWLATLGVAAMAVAWPGFLPEVRPGWSHLFLSLAFIPHLDPRGLPFPTLPPGWSLTYEAVFYLVFAAALAGPRAWRARMVTGALVAITAAGFILADPVYFLGANPMLLQFAAGVGLGAWIESNGRPDPVLGATFLVTAAILWAVVETSGLFSELWRPLLWGVPAWLTVAGALAFEREPRDRAAPSILERAGVKAGDASYAIYLLHLPVTAVVAHTLGWANPMLFAAVSLAASALAGFAAHTWLERPLTQAMRRLAG